MDAHPLLGGNHLALARAGKVAGDLLQAVESAVVVVEHRRVPVELHELADAPQRRLGIADQVLVAQLGVVAHPRALLARDPDALRPPVGRLGHAARAEVQPGDRDRQRRPRGWKGRSEQSGGAAARLGGSTPRLARVSR